MEYYTCITITVFPNPSHINQSNILGLTEGEGGGGGGGGVEQVDVACKEGSPHLFEEVLLAG